MSTKKPIFPVVLTVLALLGMASAEPAEPPPKEPGEAAQAPPSEQQGVILLVDGQVVQGVIVQDDEGCLLKSSFGSMRFPRRRIEATFRTLREAYEYKLSQFPEEDTGERLKLAQWCLAQNLREEAKAQLLGILKINPKHPPATAMLQKMEQAEVRQARRRLDPGVQQAGATSDELPPTGPKQLDPTALRRRGAGMMAGGIADIPNVFDLPRPTALKISEDFNRSIHPILQTSCAKCHNDRYPGAFQLRQVRRPRDLNRDTLNLNLEAALHLIDPLNPAKSELLSSSLRPHGYGKSQHPIFRGSADPSYQKLSQWVNSVCKPFKKDALRQAGATSDEEQFAADRAVNLGSPAAIDAPNRQIMPIRPQPAIRVPERPGAGPYEFPLVTQENATALRTTGILQAPPSAPSEAAQAAELPKLPPGTASTPAAPSVNKPKKSVKIDPAALERVLKARNGGN